jgi:outer membrane receptor protein involved in Fe transport
MRRLRNCLAVVFFLLGTVWASAQVTTGTISGTITDPSGAVLPNVKVEVLNEGTGVSRTVATDAAGRYSAPMLPVGNYKVSGSIEGFQTELRSGIVLTVGREATIDMRMQVGAVSQTVEVTGEAPLVQTTEATVSYTITSQTIRELPLNGRDLSQLILLNPGVTQSNTAGGEAYNGYGKRISISGMRGEDNTYLLDGGLIGDHRRHIPAGPSGAMLGLEAVQEFQVLTNAFGAQYGRALGGVFNAVSKSGTNDWHGSAYDYLRNSALDARNFFDRQEEETDPRLPPFRRNQFGASLGGPVKRDAIFFFASYESTREVLSETNAPVTMDANLRRGFLPNGNCVPISATNAACAPLDPIATPYINQYPLPTANGRTFADGTGEHIWEYKKPTTEHFGLTRIDLPSLTDNDSLFGRFIGSNSQGTQAETFPGFEQSSSNGSWALTLSETHIVSPVALNTVRFHFSRVVPFDTGNAPPPAPGITVVPGQPDAPEINVTGLTVYGGGGFATKPTFMIANRFTYQDDMTWRMGNHGLQFGGFIERLQLNSRKDNRGWGVWTFTSVSNLLQANPGTYRGAIPNFSGETYRRGFRQWSMALYIQDDWRITDRFTLNLGVRWEPYTVPTEVNGLISNLRYHTDTEPSLGDPYWINQSWGDIGPRLGIAWTPFASGKTSIRAGFGILYAPNDPNTYYNQMDRNPPYGYDFTLPIANKAASQFPNARAQIGTQRSPAYALPYEDNDSSRAIHWNFNIQQQLGGNSLLTVGYAGNRANHLISVGDLNTPRAFYNGVSLELPANASLVNPAWPSINFFANNTNSFYNSLQMSYQKRFSSGFQAAMSYTWSKNLAGADSGQTGGGVSGGGGRQKVPYDPAAQWGLSGYDFRHMVSFNYAYDFPDVRDMGGIVGAILSGWRTSGALSMKTGQPLNLAASVATALPAAGTGFSATCCSLNQLAVNPRSPNVAKVDNGSNVLSDGRDPNKYIDVSAYSAPGPRELGNLGRNTMIGPGSITWNPGVTKRIPIRESINLEFRTEIFNALNRANFGPPANNLFNAGGNPVATAGVISTTNTTSRQLQFALKLNW